ncbi:MAG: S8 family serine peptidase, partial [Actinomycetota bacterium]|nr:S8 family serine peptidase [Actinomycetota bacterium]
MLGRAGTAIATIVVALAATAPWAAAQSRPIERELIVRYEAGTSGADRAAVRRDAGVVLERDMLLPGAELVEVPRTEDFDAARARLAADPRVARVERNRLVQALGTPNDPRFGELWGMQSSGDHDIDAPEAWDTITGSPNVVVAIIDTGVEGSHSDLAPNMWTNADEIAGNGIDDDANGFVDDRLGWDFAYDNATPEDVYGHGTHVAGTVGARGNNGIGVAGVTWDVDLMPVKVLDDWGYGSWADVADGILYAHANGADVMNLSLGGWSGSQTVQDAIKVASSSLLAIAAGNSSEDVDQYPHFPCAYPEPNIICVAATDQGDNLAYFSNWGAEGVDLAAPGVDTLSTVPGNDETFEETIATVDTFEAADFAARWEATGTPTFTRTQEKAAGGTGWSMTDSPGGQYGDYANAVVTLRAPIAADGSRRCAVGFDMERHLESGYDYLYVEYSTDGTTWSSLKSFTGHSPGFAPEIAPLPTGTATFRLRFRMTSDSIIPDDGVHIDNVRVQCATSTALVGSYETFSGTSMATPHVAGAAALVMAHRPSLTVGEVKAALMFGGDPLPVLDGETVSGRRLNVPRALIFEPPTLGPASASGMTPTRSTLTATVDHRGLGGTWFVEYTPRIAHADTQRVLTRPMPDGPGQHQLTRTVVGLESSTTYDAVVVVETAAGRRESTVT